MRALTSLLATAAILVTAPIGQVFAQQASPAGQVSAQDRTFATDAMQGNKFEIDAGKLAQKRGSSDQVHQFGKRMVDDHGKAEKQLSEIAKSLKINKPKHLSSDMKGKLDQLSKQKGQAFDRLYGPMMLTDHQSDIAKYQTEIQQGQNDELKSYAQQTLPVLQQHLQMAQEIASPQGAQLPEKSH